MVVSFSVIVPASFPLAEIFFRQGTCICINYPGFTVSYARYACSASLAWSNVASVALNKILLMRLEDDEYCDNCLAVT